MRNDDQTGGPLCLRNLRRFSGEFFTIWTGGLAADKAKVLDQAEWRLTIPRSMLGGPNLKSYRLGVAFAETVCDNLCYAAKIYDGELKQKGRSSQVVRQVFWQLLDDQQQLLLLTAASSHLKSDMKTWQRAVLASSWVALEEVCPRQSARQLQAFSAAKGQLAKKEKTLKAKEEGA